MIRTHGLTHLSLAVPDPDRSARFYVEVFGAEVYFRDEAQVQLKGPGPWDVLAFERRADPPRPDGIRHFGFRLVAPGDIDAAVAEVLRAGGTLIRRGEFAPGCPYAYVADLDGHTIEIWYE